MSKASLAQQLEALEQNVYLDSEGRESHCYNFYDWFCRDSSLENKAKRLYSNVRTFLKHTPSIDTTKVYVFFKNNCPLGGSLYDSFSICDIETGDVIYWVTAKSGHSGMAEVYFAGNGFGEPTQRADTFTDLFRK